MARISEEFASKWLKAEDLGDEGDDLTLTIDAVGIEEFQEQNGKKSRKVILQFRELFNGKPKGMILNVTNRNIIVKLYGDDTDDWEGRKITLYPTQVTFDGKQVDSIRVKSKAPKAATKTEAKPVAPREPGEDDDAGDDEVPY